MSFEKFDFISNHLLSKIGEPNVKSGEIEINKEKCWIWQIREIKIKLYLFEQHVFKLHFSIEQN